MRPTSHRSRLAALLGVLFGLTAGGAPAADRATVRGRIDSVDPPARRVTVRTAAGDDLTLTAGDLSRLSADGKPATLDQFRTGQRVRVTYEKAGAVNRIVTLRTAVPTEADLTRDVRDALQSARGYTFAQKERYEEKLRGVVEDVDDRIDDLRDRAAAAAADARPGIEARIQELKRTRDEFEKRLDRAKPAAADAWDSLKAGVGAAADDLQRALDRFRDEPKK